MNISVCFITTTHNPYDTRVFKKECWSLTRAGYVVTLIAPVETSGLVVDAITIKGFGKPATRFRRAFLVFKVASLALVEKAAVYHVHELELLLLLPFLRIVHPKAKFIYDVHENYDDAINSDEKHWIPLWLKQPIAVSINMFEKVMARFTDLVIAASPDIEQRFKMPHTMSVRNFAPMYSIDGEFANRTSSPRMVGPVQIVYSGSITKTRGIIEILDAIQILEGKVPVTFKITGWFHDPELQRQAQNHPAFKYVEFLGRLERFEDMLAAICQGHAAMMCFHPDKNLDSAVERSNKLFEYLGMGIPVIIAHQPQWAELIEKHDCGLVVDSKNPAAIAEKIRYVSENRAEMFAKGLHGRAAVKENYCWETEAEKLISAYQMLTAHQGGNR